VIRTAIVEDEPLAVDRLRSALASHVDVELVGEAQDGLAAVSLLDTYRPSLVFLDVRLPGFSGLEVLRRTCCKPAVIFTTAHDEYAVHAFEWGAFDYLVKPFDHGRVAVALDRYRHRSGASDAETEVVERLHTAESHGLLQRFFVRHRGVAIPVATDDIIAILAEGDYCRVHVAQSSYLVHLPLREFERRLDPQHFRRIHRSAIVQLKHVRQVEGSGRGASLLLTGGITVAASRAGATQLRELHL
jgi:two-component system, LytTR family, response regulator